MKRANRLAAATLGTLLLAMGPLPARVRQAESERAQSPVRQRLMDMVRLIQSGDRGEARRYAEENYAPDFLRIPMEQHLDFVSSLHDMTRGVRFVRMQQEEPTRGVALLEAELAGDWVALALRIEPEAPHRIAGLGMDRPQPPPGSQPAGKLTDSEIVRELEAYVQKLADADVFSGAVLLASRGRPIFRKAYGIANKDFDAPNRIDTRFNLGSMNKMFTSVAIAQLVERGKLSYDDPLAKFLPDFPSREAAEKIRIRHLLTHTSGLGSYFNRKFMESSRALYRTVDDMMKLAQGETLRFEPGSQRGYSNTGMLVLGAVIEKVTGQSYFDYIRENIYEPAGMGSSDCYELDMVNPNLAVGYQKHFTDKGIEFRNNLFEHVIRGGPAGGGYSTVEDLLRFAVALQSNRLVGAEHVGLLLSAKPELNSPNYGYGFQIDRDLKIAGHGGGFAGISSNLDMFLESGYTAVVLSNYGRASAPVQQKIRELVGRAATGSAAP